jgi:hypothetical protein
MQEGRKRSLTTIPRVVQRFFNLSRRQAGVGLQWLCHSGRVSAAAVPVVY